MTPPPLHGNRPAPAGAARTLRLAAALAALAAAPAAFALGQPQYVTFAPEAGSFPIVADGAAAPIHTDPGDWAGVLRAAGDLQADVARVSGITPVLVGDADTPRARIVVVGTIGRNRFIDRLIAEGRLDVAPIAGQWESFLIQVVPDPLPDVGHALVIAGSDKRGTIYGVYDLSEQMGVSPWYWWADVPADPHDAIHVRAGACVQGPPSVKYRGLFLNDEAPALTNWVVARYGRVAPRADPPVPSGVANYGHEFYERMFEVILRLKGNYLWPAMWNNAFNEDDLANARLADEYGVVMGTSHQEPMLRAQKEWDRRYAGTLGSWNYATHPAVLQQFWREGVRRNRAYESIVTIGLRGADDTPMAPGGPAANRALLEQIVDVQRQILREEIDPDITRVPQLWCLYKEVQEFYEDGMRAPDDVTLLWAEDNWGNVRRLPTADERPRRGGAGVYYHFDYHGGPRSYQWLNTNPIAKIWDQMSLARQYGADRIWIVNAGHFKGYELPLEFFLSLAWDADRWTHENLGEFTRLWAGREFGPEHAAEIAGIVAGYTKYNGRRKPELLVPSTYSLVDYREAETVVADYNAIAARAEALHARLPVAARDAFYQLVLFPTKACALVNKLYLAAAKNALYAEQGRASTNAWATETQTLFQEDLALMDYFNNTFAGGRWNHFMDQTHLGYVSWRDPPTNSLQHITLRQVDAPAAAALGVAVEGSTSAWPGATGQPALPQFDAFTRPIHFIEVFNRGRTAFSFTATASAPWIALSATTGTVGNDVRLSVGVDWDAVPAGTTAGTVAIRGAGATVTVGVEAFNPTEVTRATLVGFVEARRHVAIEPEHFTRNTSAGDRDWIRVEDYGRTLSGLRAEAPVDAAPATPGVDSPCLEYRMYLFSTGSAQVSTMVAPTLNFLPDRPLRFAISFDDAPPQTVTLVPAGFQARNGNAEWEESVRNNARTGVSSHTIAAPGYHTLKVWMVDPGVLVQRLIVDLGGVHPSYLGPPESFRSAGPPSVARQPVSQTVATGQSVSLVACPGGAGPFTFQWRRGGAPIEEATAPMLTLTDFSAADEGLYDVVITNAAASVISAPARLRLGPGDASRLVNISSRTEVGTDDGVTISGFVVAAAEPKTFLIRGLGPGLAAFGVGDFLPEPVLTLFEERTPLVTNVGWLADGDADAIRAVADEVGAFPLDEDGRDCALLATLDAGIYSAHLRDRNGVVGVGLIEVYDADTTEARNLANVSTRAFTGPGMSVLIAGFVVTGTAPRTVLIRGVGPGLRDYDVAGVLEEPVLTVFAGEQPIVSNRGWTNFADPAAIESAGRLLGAFDLAPASTDSALVLTLQPGPYSIHVGGAAGTVGIALAEVYALPADW